MDEPCWKRFQRITNGPVVDDEERSDHDYQEDEDDEDNNGDTICEANDHQDDEDNDDDAICKVNVPKLNGTDVSMQLATYTHNGESSNNDNVTCNVFIPKDASKQTGHPLKDMIPTSLMNLTDN